MIRVHLDFETYGVLDLSVVGSTRYAKDPNTGIMSLAYQVEAENYGTEPVLLKYECGEEILSLNLPLVDLAKNPKAIWVAHNAAFEQDVWQAIMVERYGYPPIPPERWICTMAKAYAHGLPGGLDKAAEALKLEARKDMDGKKSMMLLTKPNPKTGKFWTYEEKPDDYEKMWKYNVQDLAPEIAIDKALRDLSEDEQEVWIYDQKINQRGLLIDRELVQKAIGLRDTHLLITIEDFKNQGLDFNPSQRKPLLAWLQSRLGPQIKDTTKATITQIQNDPGTPQDVRYALLLQQGASKTSLAKLDTMLERSDEDGRLYGEFNYHAAHTGRWGGRGVQLQNLAKPKYSITTLCKAIDTCSYENFSFLYPDVTEALSSALRGMIVAPEGQVFFGGDLAQMEARIVTWLADYEEKLDRFRQGIDMYCLAASDIFGRTITKADKDERQIGKVAELALGYGGGIGAFANMAKGYGLDLWEFSRNIQGTSKELEAAEYAYGMHIRQAEEKLPRQIAFACDIIKQRWREANQKIVWLWAQLEQAACDAVISGKPVQCGKLRFFMHDRFLFCRLPSGRCIAYPYPSVKVQGNRKTLSYGIGWSKESTYGGKLAENVTQAVQRDLLADAIVRLEKNGYEVALHVHDEIAGVKEGGSLEEFVELMKEIKPWAAGIPVNVEGWTNERYIKS